MGGVFGIQAIGNRQDADKLARTSTDPDSHRRYDDLVGEMEGNRTVADVLVTSGSVLMLGGLTWLVWPE